MSCGLAIFVKTPGLSPVKTRLWPAIGQRAAEAVYLMAAEAVASVAERVRRPKGITPYWAVAEREALHTELWSDLPNVAQGDGSLGDRMCSVFDALLDQHDTAMLIGADAPQLRASDLEEAARWLVSPEKRLVMGRAEDGGFWLVGANFPIPRAAWTSVTYSASTTADEFIRSLAGAGAWAWAPVLRDLDTMDDIAPLTDALDRLPDTTPLQARLAAWLAKYRSHDAPACPQDTTAFHPHSARG